MTFDAVDQKRSAAFFTGNTLQKITLHGNIFVTRR